MSTPHSFENTLRIHDEAFDRWLNGLTVDYGNLGGSSKLNHPILRVMATPERAFAALHNQLIKQGFVTGGTVDEQLDNAKAFKTAVLPLASIERIYQGSHLEYGGVPKRLRTQVLRQGVLEYESHPWPGMHQVEYRLNLWCLKHYTLAYMQEWILSQLGLLGTAETEVWINVDHGDPWGTLLQAMRLTSNNTLHNHEGEEDQRYFRHEFSFTLNTIHFRPVAETHPYVDTIDPRVSWVDGVAGTDGVTTEPDALGDSIVPVVASSNLYRPYVPPALVPTQWPTAGNATVDISSLAPPSAPARSTLVVGVTDTTDIADFANVPMHLESGRAILYIHFRLLSDAATVLDVFQNDGSHTPGTTPAWESCRQIALPAQDAWRWGSFFVLVTQQIVDVSVRGSGVAAVARFGNLSVRRLSPATEIAPATGPVVEGADNVYTWTGLEMAAYLVVVPLTSGTGTAQAENDDTAPTETVSETLDDSVNQGAVLLLQPLTTTLALRVSTSLTIAAPYAQRYDGAYAGYEL